MYFLREGLLSALLRPCAFTESKIPALLVCLSQCWTLRTVGQLLQMASGCGGDDQRLAGKKSLLRKRHGSRHWKRVRRGATRCLLEKEPCKPRGQLVHGPAAQQPTQSQRPARDRGEQETDRTGGMRSEQQDQKGAWSQHSHDSGDSVQIRDPMQP